MSVNISCDKCKDSIENDNSCYCFSCYDSLEAEVKELKEALESKQDELNALDNTCSELESKIEKLESELKALNPL